MDSHACGLNFLGLCNDVRVADGLHVAASMLMSEGLGYAGEGDWVTAMLVRGMQQGFGVASFSEIFSIGYDDNRLLLKHWGEGNFAMARAKPRLLASKFTDQCTAEFAICRFRVRAGAGDIGEPELHRWTARASLLSISGTIDRGPSAEDRRASRGIQADRENVREVLTEYAYAGGSHHMALVKGARRTCLKKVCRLAGWSVSAAVEKTHGSNPGTS